MADLAFFILLLTAIGPVTVVATSESASEACNDSSDHKFCRSLLAQAKSSSNPNDDYSLYFVKHALKQAHVSVKLIDDYLSKGDGQPQPRGVPTAGIGALEDCRKLASLNANFLETVRDELVAGAAALDRVGVLRVKTLMSALVTNQHTCFDGLQDSRSFPELYGALENETRVYVVSLDLVTLALKRRHMSRVEVKDSVPEFHGPPIFGRSLEEGDISRVPLRQSVIVAQDGTGNFTTISDAVAFIPDETPINDGYNAIFIRAGVYKENVVVMETKKNLIMIGAGVDQTVITGNRSVADGWTTLSSATFAVYGERFIAMNITFENTAGPEKHQAVAFQNSANLSSLYLCRFLGYQDTLYARSQLQFYRDCEIHGTVDFIFGDAASVFQHCAIIARRPLPGQYIAITAQGRQNRSEATGIVIHNCTISAASDLKSTQGSIKSYLGRPWKEYSRTVYMQSQIDGFIDPKGWIEWNNSGFALSTLFYGEFENNGTGANTSARVQWPGYTLMNRTQAVTFTVGDFIAGDLWLPPIPYQLGLL